MSYSDGSILHSRSVSSVARTGIHDLGCEKELNDDNFSFFVRKLYYPASLLSKTGMSFL
jgi:hypothetical protein